MSKKKPDVIQAPLLPLRDLIIFPKMMMFFFVGREKSINALEEAMSKKTNIILSAQKDAALSDPTEDQIYSIGTLVSILQMLRLPDGTVKVLIEGKHRVKIDKFIKNENFLLIEAKELIAPEEDSVELSALMRSLKTSFEDYVKLNKSISPEALMKASSVEDPSTLSDIIAANINLKLEDKQKLLETIKVGKRLETILEIVTGEIEILEVEKKIRGRVKKQMEKSQKEYYLNEQMQAIQKELGEKDAYATELLELEKQVKNKKMPKEAKDKALKEIKKLKMMSSASAEATVVRNYVDWIFGLPWQNYKPLKTDLNYAQKILDEDHWGLEKIKERIIENLAVQTLAKKNTGPILCLVGPPGVGKTSLARSVARALGRDFARISLGGVRDEAEIRGHRKTYVGAMPGKILQSMRKVSSGNPLILLDEVDKMSSDFRGDPSSALLEVLDSEQNNSFQDHYLELEYDLSKVMFVTTANSLHNILKPLLDRMEVIFLNSYIEQEKYHISTKYLIPKQIKEHGLQEFGLQFTDNGIYEVIRHYTKEAGVRSLERKIATLCRKVAKKIILEKQNLIKQDSKDSTKKSKTSGIVLNAKKVRQMLGKERAIFSKIEEKDEIGATHGLAFTEVGGDLLLIEATVVPGKGKFVITGQLGNVMKESCSAALSYVRSRGPVFGLASDIFTENDVHIHVPEGGVPKEGPSAGIAITTSIVSAFLKIPVRRTVAMTGEVTLRGKILPIGGLKEKILAGHRAGIKTIFIPQENKKDLIDIPKTILKSLDVIPVEYVDQVLTQALNVKSSKEIFKITSLKVRNLKAKNNSDNKTPPLC